MKRAGLHVVDEGEVACPVVFRDTKVSWRANASAGVNQAAIAQSGEAQRFAPSTQTRIASTRARMEPSGTRIFLWAAGKRM
jgi:hypothetical protein